MKNRKIISLMLVLVFAVSLLSGCSGYKSPKRIKSSYPEWIEYLKPVLDAVKVTDYTENDNCIYLETQGSLADYGKLITTHNEFIEKNPDYFSKGEKIKFADYSGGRTLRHFYNSVDSDDLMTYLNGGKADIYPDRNGKMICTFIDWPGEAWVFGDDNINTQLGFLSEVKVLVLDVRGENGHPDKWDFLKFYPNLERLVLITNWEYDTGETMYEDIISMCPDVKIITADFAQELHCYGE